MTGIGALREKETNAILFSIGGRGDRYYIEQDDINWVRPVSNMKIR